MSSHDKVPLCAICQWYHDKPRRCERQPKRTIWPVWVCLDFTRDLARIKQE